MTTDEFDPSKTSGMPTPQFPEFFIEMYIEQINILQKRIDMIEKFLEGGGVRITKTQSGYSWRIIKEKSNDD